MKLVKVGAAIVNQTPLDWDGNTRNILTAISRARDESVDILCLPEMCIPGYGCQDAFHSPSVHRAAMDVLLDDIVPACQGIVVCVGLPVVFNNSIFNGVAVICDGAIAGFVCKRYLAGDGVHYEPRWFKAWKEGFRAQVEVRDIPYPIGDLNFDVSGIKLGFEICEDAWVAKRPGSSMAGQGVDIILNPSASHFAFGKLDVRKRFVIEGSRAFGVTYVYSNLLGNDSGRICYDGGALIASQGKLIAAGPRFGYDDVVLTAAVVDVEQTRMIQGWTNSYRPTFEYSSFVTVTHTFGELKPQPPTTAPHIEVWDRPGTDGRKEEEFTRALCLCLFDYMRRSYSRGFVVSLSGGADSSACVVLVRLMVESGVSRLGLDGFKAKLSYFSEIQACTSVEEIMPHMLICVYQSTRNSGDVTRDAAERLARAIGASFLELDVDHLVQGYVGLIEDGIGRSLTWSDDDITLQNIQARSRAPSVWMLANIRGALLVSTSNRSEAAVGYATMDGDTCGGISPIAGIDKDFLRCWLRWMENTGPYDLNRVPELRVVNAQQPTAELRPQQAGQTDEADLMPYDLLDAIERAAIRDKQDPLECFHLMHATYPAYAPQQVAQWVERFFKLWCRNQWKRERYAPSFHVDDENLDPKTWCRFPILNSGYRRELAELRAYVSRHFG